MTFIFWHNGKINNAYIKIFTAPSKEGAFALSDAYYAKLQEKLTSGQD